MTFVDVLTHPCIVRRRAAGNRPSEIESCLQRVKFYATDIGEAAIRQARQATYSPAKVTEIPPDLLEKYFEQTEQGYVFHPKLRRTILFGRHDLAKDAPISKVDLLTCRNALMYFNAEIQAFWFACILGSRTTAFSSQAMYRR